MLPFPPPGDLSYPGTELVSPVTSELQADSLPTEPLGKPSINGGKKKVKYSHSVMSLYDAMGCSPSGSAHAILQARTLEWIVISFSKGFSQPRDPTWVSCIGQTSEPPGKPSVIRTYCN